METNLMATEVTNTKKKMRKELQAKLQKTLVKGDTW